MTDIAEVRGKLERLHAEMSFAPAAGDAIRDALDLLIAQQARIDGMETCMPTIWEDPAGKGYPCFERSMTPKECADVLDRYGQRIIALSEAVKPFAAICAGNGDDFSSYPPETVIRCEVSVREILAARLSLSAEAG